MQTIIELYRTTNDSTTDYRKVHQSEEGDLLLHAGTVGERGEVTVHPVDSDEAATNLTQLLVDGWLKDGFEISDPLDRTQMLISLPELSLEDEAFADAYIEMGKAMEMYGYGSSDGDGLLINDTEPAMLFAVLDVEQGEQVAVAALASAGVSTYRIATATPDQDDFTVIVTTVADEEPGALIASDSIVPEYSGDSSPTIAVYRRGESLEFQQVVIFPEEASVGFQRGVVGEVAELVVEQPADLVGAVNEFLTAALESGFAELEDEDYSGIIVQFPLLDDPTEDEDASEEALEALDEYYEYLFESCEDDVSDLLEMRGLGFIFEISAGLGTFDIICSVIDGPRALSVLQEFIAENELLTEVRISTSPGPDPDYTLVYSTIPDDTLPELINPWGVQLTSEDEELLANDEDAAERIAAAAQLEAEKK